MTEKRESDMATAITENKSPRRKTQKFERSESSDYGTIWRKWRTSLGLESFVITFGIITTQSELNFSAFLWRNFFQSFGHGII